MHYIYGGGKVFRSNYARKDDIPHEGNGHKWNGTRQLRSLNPPFNKNTQRVSLQGPQMRRAIGESRDAET